MALDKQGVPRPRCVGIVETCEESGSYDLLPYVDALRSRLGNVALVVCLDSGAGNYDQLWMTTSLRGMVSGTLEVQVLDEGVHSGDSSGVVPSSFRILRHLLDRLEDSSTGRLLPQSLHCEIPADRVDQVHATARILGDEVWRRFLELRRRRRLRAAHDHRARTGPAEPHLASDAVGDRRRGPAAAVQRRQRAASAHRLRCRCACRRWSTPWPPRRRSRRCWKPTRRTTPRSSSRPTKPPPAGTRRPRRPG